MVIETPLIGKTVVLRSAEERDSEFILELRNNPEISKYLPKLDVTPERQREWIKRQRRDLSDYYFIISEKETGNAIGTISVYNIRNDVAETGRLACIGEPEQAIEASLLLFDFVFYTLHVKKIEGWVYKENRRALRYNSKFGYTFKEGSYEGTPCMLGTLDAENYEHAVKRLKAFYRE